MFKKNVNLLSVNNFSWIILSWENKFVILGHLIRVNFVLGHINLGLFSGKFNPWKINPNTFYQSTLNPGTYHSGTFYLEHYIRYIESEAMLSGHGKK